MLRHVGGRPCHYYFAFIPTRHVLLLAPFVPFAQPPSFILLDTTAMAALPTITIAELEKHSNAKSCYVSIGSKVYDVTEFLNDHPGGDEIVIEYARAHISPESPDDMLMPPDMPAKTSPPSLTTRSRIAIRMPPTRFSTSITLASCPRTTSRRRSAESCPHRRRVHPAT